MKIWFDTEFYENGKTIELISIGAIREDGATYYAESPTGYDAASIDPWLVENVRPHLVGGENVKHRDVIAADLIEFAGERPEFWAYYADYDWVVLCQLFGRMIDLPKGWPMYCRDIKQWCDSLGNPELPKQESAEHNALADAVWNRQAWEFLASCQYMAERKAR
ncbi:MAG: 3'-5' exonuclease [Devosia marina]|uniref:3'-5' exonuclease n=1 Tax=Devosia marina TaxID=2683198 RepID=UPI0032EC0212